jgi:hypothetical protein
MTEAYKKVLQGQIKEEGEVSMAIGQLKTTIENAQNLLSALQGKGEDYDIEAWIQAKITDAEHGMSAIADYMKNNPEASEDEMEESVDLEEAFMDAYVIRFKDKGASENSVVVFKQEHDKDIYVDFLKKKGAKVLSVKKQNLNMKV